MNQSLQIQQQQGLHLTAQLLQGITMVAMPAQELVEYVRGQIDQNPFLEEAPAQPTATEPYGYCPSTDELSQKLLGKSQIHGDGSYQKPQTNYSFEQYLTQQPTPEEYLLAQLNPELASKTERFIAQYLIGNLDNNGYLRATTAEVAGCLGVHINQVRLVLGKLQACSPAGVGARNIQEYLLLQLRASGKATPLAAQVIVHHLAALASGKLEQIARQLAVPVASVQAAQDLIRTFNAHINLPAGNQPGNAIWPEVLVTKQSDGFLVTMQDLYLPQLTINQDYVALAQSPGISKPTAKYLRSERRQAEALINGISQRRNSIFAVASCIVKAQAQFLDKGLSYLVPLTMAQVAKATQLSESTVSRVAGGNYIQTPQGVFELRYFFCSGVTGSAGADISSKSIKHQIQDLVSAEDPALPLSDTQIQEALAEQGITISRRTVNKYRTALAIPPNTQRKRHQ
jgi:RNA polymerase sigma-54 factor